MTTTNQMKCEMLDRMARTTMLLRSQMRVLDNLDMLLGSSGNGDLMDQMVSINDGLNRLEAALKRANSVVPTTDGVAK